MSVQEDNSETQIPKSEDLDETMENMDNTVLEQNKTESNNPKPEETREDNKVE